MNQKVKIESKLVKLSLLFVVLSLAAISFNISKVSSDLTPTFSIDPANVTAKAGSILTVKIYFIDADYCYSWQVLMRWNNAILSFQSYVFGGFLTDQPEGSTTAVRVEANWFSMSESTSGGYLGKSAARGLLLTVRFLVLAETVTTLDIQDPIAQGTFFLKCYVVPTLIKTYPVINNGYYVLPKLEDLNTDGWIDVFDISTVAINYGKTGSPGWIPADLNDDGVVDIVDLSMVAIKFGDHYAN